MRANRQDAWTKEEDRLLANNVIDYIKKGYTQLEGFKHVAEQLNRTPAACGFRWNATIRKRYTKEIETAKQARKKIHYEDANNVLSSEESSSVKSVDQAIHWLEKLKLETKNQSLIKRDANYYDQIEENKRLKEELAIYRSLLEKIKLLTNEIE